MLFSSVCRCDVSFRTFTPLVAAAIMLLVPLARPALAQITVTEPPDLSNVLSPPPSSLGTIGLGDSTITGGLSASVSGTNTVGDHADAVTLTVPAGMAITLVELSVSNFAGATSGNPPIVTIQSGAGGGGGTGFAVSAQCATSGTTAAAIPTLGTGTYTIAVQSGLSFANNPSGSTRSFNYILRLHAVSMIAFTEGASGAATEFGSSLSATAGEGGAVGTLALGENHIIGSINAQKFPNQPSFGDQADFFTFDVPLGGASGALVVTGITVRMTDRGSTPNCVDPRVTDESGGVSVRLTHGSEGPFDFPIIGGVLMPGTHELRVYASTLNACAPGAFGASLFFYDITITTAAETGGGVGACCNRATGHCIPTYSAACAAMGMTFNGAFTACSPATCPPPAPACPADFNGSGVVSVQDIFDFLAAYFAGCL